MYFYNSEICISLFLLFVPLYIWKLYFSGYRNGSMDFTKTHGMVQTWTHGIDMDSWYRHGLMVKNQTYGTDMDSW